MSEKEKNKANLTIHLEDPQYYADVFQELVYENVEWDHFEDGSVLAIEISKDPHKMVNVFLPHSKIEKLIQEYRNRPK